MEELQEQKEELQATLAASKLRADLGLKQEHILYFLQKFAQVDHTDESCQKQLVKTFVNSVFVYDDKVVLTFNYSSDDRTITLHEIDAGLQHGVRLPRALSHHRKKAPVWVLFFCGEDEDRGEALGFECKHFPIEDGRRASTAAFALQKKMRRITKAAKPPEYCPHSNKHTVQ